MQKIIFIFCLLLPILSFSQSNKVDSFDDMMSALKKGKSLSVVFDYSQCQLISDNKISEDSIGAIGGMGFDTWEFFEKGCIRNKKAFVVSSVSKLIANPLGEGYVYNYVKVKVYDDQKVSIKATYVDAVTMEEIMDESFYTSMTSEGANFFIIK